MKQFCIILCSLLFSFNICAEEYKITNVEIHASGNPIEARNKALADGQRSALVSLLTKLSKESSLVEKLSESEISAMIKDVEFISEKMSVSNYRATVNYNFDPGKIENWLGSNHIEDKSLKQTSQASLIIPIFIRGTQTIIWQDYNYWNASIDRSITKLSLEGKYVIPMGEIDDVEILSDDLMASGDFSRFEPIMEKYHAKNAIVAIAHYFLDPKTNYPSILLNLRYIEKNQEKKLEKLFSFKEGGSLHVLLDQVAEFLLTHKKSDIISANIIPKLNNMLPIEVRINKFDDWVYIKQKLYDLCGQNNVIIKKLSSVGASLEVNQSNILGDISQLLLDVGIKSEKKSNILILSK